MVSVPTLQLCCGVKAALAKTDKWAWLCSNKALFMGAEIEILYNFDIMIYYFPFDLFSNHLKM